MLESKSKIVAIKNLLFYTLYKMRQLHGFGCFSYQGGLQLGQFADSVAALYILWDSHI